LSAELEKQAINYLMLSRLNYAKIINFGTKSVEARFVSTNINPGKRFDLQFEYEHWINFDNKSYWLKDLVERLLTDWGAFLEVNLFYEAIEFFLGGREKILKNIQIKFGNRILGSQKVHLISPDVAFKITSLTKEMLSFERNLYRFLETSSLKAIQWINFDHNSIVFKTIF